MHYFNISSFKLWEKFIFPLFSEHKKYLLISRDIFIDDKESIYKLELWLKYDKKLLNNYFLSFLLQSSLFKGKYLVSNYIVNLLSQKSLELVSIHEHTMRIKPLLDHMITGGLYNKNLYVWCCLFAAHRPQHLLGLDKDYCPETFNNFFENFIRLPYIKKYFQDKNNRDELIELSHPQAKKIYEQVFFRNDLENDLSKKNISQHIVHKI